MKKAYRIMAATLTLAMVLGNVDLAVFATEATYSVKETEVESVEDVVVSSNQIMEEIEKQTDENGLEEISETEEIQSEDTEAVEENNEDFEEPTETVLTIVEEQVTEAETLDTVVIESSEEVENDGIMGEPTETVLTIVEEQVTEAETLDEEIKTTEDTVSGNDMAVEEPTETSPTVGEQDEEAETLGDNIIKFIVTFVDFNGNEVYSVEVSEVDEIELPEAPELEGYEFIKWDVDLSTLELAEDLVIKPIYEEIEVEEPELAYCELSKTVDNKVVSIKGIMPENAKIVVEKVNYTTDIKNDIEESLNDNATVVVYEAFDIKIKVGDTEYQPNEFDESVIVSIKNIVIEDKEGEELKVFHIDNSNNIEEVESTVDVSNNVAEFVAESFSVYVIGGVTYDTDNATLLDNNYGTAYLYSDGTLLVTEFKQSTSQSNYPWNSQKANITSVRFADTVTEIPDSAFSGYTNLTGSIVLPNNLQTIGTFAFYNCSKLTGSLTIPDGVQTIGAYAFYNCSGFNGELKLSNSLQSIGANAFYNCSGFIGTLVIPDSVASLGEANEFYNCSGFTGLILSNNLINIGKMDYYYNGDGSIDVRSTVRSGTSQSNTFYGCSGFTGNLVIPDSVEWIGDYAFYECSGLDGTLTIGNGVKMIRQCAFYDCSKLRGNLIFSESVLGIGDYAFYGCSGLGTDLVFKGDTIITLSAFYNNTGVKNITFEKGQTYNYINAFYCDDNVDTTVVGVDDSWNAPYDVMGMPNTWYSWNRRPIELEFNPENGDSSVTAKIFQNEMYTVKNIEPTEPVRDGYEFKGWYFIGVNLDDWYDGTHYDTLKIFYDFNKSLNNQIQGDYYIDNEHYVSMYPNKTDLANGMKISLYAEWEEIKKYEVSFETNGATPISSVEIRENYTVTKPSNPMKAGHTFKGWFTDENFANEYDFSTPVTSAFTLYAKFEINKYEIQFNSNDGSAVANQVIEYNKKLVEPIEPIKAGYDFKGWYKDAAFTDEWNFNADVVTEATTLFAKWERITYSVQFNSNGGSSVTNQVIGEGDKVVRPTDPTLTHYEFKGWFRDSNLTDEWDFNTDTVTEVTTLYAKWVELPFVYVTYILDNGESDVTSKYYEGETTVPPATPLRDKSIFEGWDLRPYDSIPVDCFVGWQDAEFNYVILHNGQLLIENHHINSGTNLAFKARYASEVIEDVNDGVTPEKITMQPYSDQYTLNTPSRVGYKFRRWNVYKNNNEETYIESQGIGRDVVYPIIYEPVIFRADWIKLHSVTFDSNGGSPVNNQVVEEGNMILKPADPMKEKHAFDGWYVGDKKWDFAVDVPTSDIELKAKWTYVPDKYQFTFNSNGGTSIESQVISEGGTAVKPADPTRKGYTFKGWFIGDEEYDFADAVNSHTTIIAKWEINDYNISFNTQGGSEIQNQKIQYNSLVTKPSNPTKEGHTFKGWYKDPAGLVEWNFDVDVVEEDRIIFAVWETNKFTVSFDSNGGSAVADQVIKFNGKVVEPEKPTKEGHKFIGWFNGTEEYDFNTSVKESITLTAKWEEIVYKNISFVTNCEQSLNDVKVEEGEVLVEPSGLSKSGYKFIGWYTEAEFINKWDFNTPVNNDITLYAKWEEVKETTPTEQPEDEAPEDEVPEDIEPEDIEPEDETPEDKEPEDIEPEDETPEDIEPEDIEPEDETPEDIESEDETLENETPEDKVYEDVDHEDTVPEDELVEEITPDEEIVADEEEAITVNNPLYGVRVEENNMKNAMAKFVEAVKIMGIVVSISLLAVLGILGILLLIIAWMKKVKVYNDHNSDDYADEDFVVVYKTSVKSEGNRLAELFKKEDRVWTLSIPENVISEKVTDTFKIELKKGFCKKYNGEQLIVVLENSNEELVKNLGFVIDEKEHEIKFTIA